MSQKAVDVSIYLTREIRIPTQDPWICLPRVARSERDGGRERRKEIISSRIEVGFIGVEDGRTEIESQK